MKRPDDVARDWHAAPNEVAVTRYELDEPDYPQTLIACGQFVRILLQTPSGPVTIEVDSPDAFLAYDQDSERGRLYIVLGAETKDELLDAFWTGEDLVTLQGLARTAGGAHQGDYVDVDVQPLGAVVQVEYYTKKYGRFGADDGAVFFHAHEAPWPWLGLDESGRLFYAGGDYDGADLRGIVG